MIISSHLESHISPKLVRDREEPAKGPKQTKSCLADRIALPQMSLPLLSERKSILDWATPRGSATCPFHPIFLQTNGRQTWKEQEFNNLAGLPSLVETQVLTLWHCSEKAAVVLHFSSSSGFRKKLTRGTTTKNIISGLKKCLSYEKIHLIWELKRKI